MSSRAGHPRRRSPRHCGPPLCLLLLMVTGSRPQTISVSRRAWAGIEPIDMPISEMPSPSLLACVRLCLGRTSGSGCAALYYETGWCRLYQYAACQAGGGGLRDTSPNTGRYVDLRLNQPLCPTDDLCSRFCPPADWSLYGHPLPGSVDVWTNGAPWGKVWKRLTEGHCEVSLAAGMPSSTDKLAVSVATAADNANITLKYSISFTRRLIYHYGERVRSWGASSSGALQPRRQLTPITVSWCDGKLRLYSAGTLVVATSPQTVPANLQFIQLSSTGAARWRLGPHVADPWMAEEDGWLAQRSYTVAAKTAIWRRIQTSSAASIEFRCLSEHACRVFFRESFTGSLQAEVRLLPGFSHTGTGDGKHSFWQSAWPLDWIYASEPHWFRVEFNAGSVAVYTRFAAGQMVWLLRNETLKTSTSFGRVPQTVQYVGLGGDDLPATFWLYEYDGAWGQEQGFTVGAALLTEQEADRLWAD